MKKVKLNYEGEEVTGTVLPFRVTTDGFIVVETADGAHLRVRTIILDVIRLDGRLNEDDEPLYVVKHGTQIVLDKLPEEVKAAEKKVKP